MPMTLTQRKISVLHLEPTDVCQAQCPQCLRETDSNFDRAKHHHLTISQITQHFDSTTIKSLQKMFMCGDYGDPAAGKHTLEIYHYFRRLNPSIVLGMNTNGALQEKDWWHELAQLIRQQRDYVVFSIDGLEDTNHIYRRGVSWERLIKNAQTFISAGGNAHWDMLVYRHNQHQIQDCKNLAQKLGFKWFRTKITNRPMTSTLSHPTGWQQESSAGFEKINCRAMNEYSVYIDAQGRLAPCCWLGGRQINWITDFNSVEQSWTSANPQKECVMACATRLGKSAFDQQWQIDQAL